VARAGLAARAAWFAAALVLVASARIVATYKVLNHTTDEPAHLAAGIEWLENGTYTYEDQHPPLARVAGAIGLHLAGARWGRGADPYFEGFHLLGYGHRYWHNLFYSRLAMLPFFWVACAVVFLWAARIAGGVAGVLATLIFTATPAILGHAGLATTDMALTAFVGAAALSGLKWMEKPDWRRSAVFGALAGLAIASKFSALVYLPVALGAIFAWRRPAVRVLLAPALVSLLCAAGVVWGAYRFSPEAGTTFAHGIRSVWEHNREGHPAWLLGRRSQHGFWYYYLVVGAVKTPLAMLALTAISMRWFRQTGLPLAFAGGVLLVASFGSINIGIRHVLPIYPGMSIACGIAALHLWQGGRAARVLAGALVGWLLVSGALCHPDYIAYTNELAGDRPDRILADSDLDWGQDMSRLAKRIFALGVPDFTFKISSPGYFAAGNDFPRIVDMPDGDRPRPGWNAISITPWRISGEPRWAETATPRERVGRGILLFWFP
jgi:hypothetical protein